jgi:hypothetical protein
MRRRQRSFAAMACQQAIIAITSGAARARFSKLIR